MALAPVTYGLYALIATIIAAKAGAGMRWLILTPVLLLSTLPFIGFAALKFGEAGMDVLKSLRPLIVSLAPGQQRTLGKLKKMRVELQSELHEVIDTFGPQYYDDFEDVSPSCTRLMVTGANS
jgi:glycerol-3-phosphate O-acyltransferase/dihydroxyacetone phosphate acyltransferase